MVKFYHTLGIYRLTNLRHLETPVSATNNKAVKFSEDALMPTGEWLSVVAEFLSYCEFSTENFRELEKIY